MLGLPITINVQHEAPLHSDPNPNPNPNPTPTPNPNPDPNQHEAPLHSELEQLKAEIELQRAADLVAASRKRSVVLTDRPVGAPAGAAPTPTRPG